MDLTLKQVCDIVDKMSGCYILLEKKKTQITYLYHTKEITALFGASEKEIRAYTSHYNLIYEEDRTMVQKIFQTISQDLELENQNYIFRMIHKRKGFIWVNLHVSRFMNVEEKEILLLSITDVSKATEISYALMEASDRYICVIEKSTKRILYANTKFYDLIDSSASEAMGKHCYELLCKVMEMKDNDGCLCYSSINANPPIEIYNNEKNMYLTLTGKEVIWGEYDSYVFYMADITDKKNKERELEESQQKFEVALANSDLMIWEYDIVNSRCITSKKAVEGYDIPLIIENYPESLFDMGHTPDETVEQIKDVKRRLLNGETGFSVERRTIDKNGISEWQKVEYTLQCDHNGTPVRAIVCGIDITKQKELEQKYKEQLEYRNKFTRNALFSVRLDMTSDRIIDYSSADEVVKSQMLCSNLASDMMSQFFVEFQIPEDDILKELDYTFASLNHAYEAGHGQYKISDCWNNKLEKYLTVNLYLDRNPSTKHLEVFYIVEDVTESVLKKKSLEKVVNKDYDFVALIDRENGKANIMASSPNAILPDVPKNWQIDYNQIIVDFAKSYRQYYHTEEDFHLVSDEMQLSMIIEKLDQMEAYEFNCKTQTAEKGIRTYRMRFTYMDDTKKFIIYSRTNITKAVENEQIIQGKLERALEEAQKADRAKTNFLSRVSHDMRTPLNGILGLTNLMKSSVQDEKIYHDLSELEISGKYLLNLINDTLDVSRIENEKLELHPAVCHGKDMFGNAIRLLKPSIDKKKIELHVKTEKIPFGMLYVDYGRMQQIMLNVVGNAVKFTPEGGKIDVILKNIGFDHGVITDELTIRDNGIGMSPEFLPHIFDAFAQEDSSRTSFSEGTGLGMAITKKLVTLMGGDIKVESEVGKGTCFTIIFKMNLATDEQIKEWKMQHESEQEEGNLKGKRILLCEDHPLNAEIAIRLLEGKGIVVDWVENGEIGLQRYKQASENYYDAILMDIRMPVMDGIETTKAIRKLVREDADKIPIIAMTANAFEDDVKETRIAGMNEHMAKPIEPRLMFSILERLLIRK